MRKMLLVVVASGAVIAVTPAAAMAKSHSRHHHVRHARIHHRRIGDASTTTTPTTTPTAPATVASFTGGVLTLTVMNADGTTSTVSGTVTNDTRLVCVSSQPTGMGPGDDQGQGDDQGDQGGDNGGGDHHDAGDEGGGGGDQGDSDQGDDESNQMCSTANLTTGTPVQFADLSIGQGGANWDTVVLQVTPSSTTPTVPDTDNDGN